MKTKFLAMVLAAFLGLAACSSSKQSQSGTDSLSGDTSSMDMNTGTDTPAAGGMADTSQTNGTTGTTADTSSMPRP